MSSHLVSVLILILVNDSLALTHYFQDGLTLENKQNEFKLKKIHQSSWPEGFRAKRSFTTFSISRPLSRLSFMIIVGYNKFCFVSVARNPILEILFKRKANSTIASQKIVSYITNNLHVEPEGFLFLLYLH